MTFAPALVLFRRKALRLAWKTQIPSSQLSHGNGLTWNTVFIRFLVLLYRAILVASETHSRD